MIKIKSFNNGLWVWCVSRAGCWNTGFGLWDPVGAPAGLRPPSLHTTPHFLYNLHTIQIIHTTTAHKLHIMGYGQGHELQDKTKSKIWKIIQRGDFFIGESRDAESFERELGRRIPSGEIPGVGSVTSSLLEKNDLCHISSDARWLPSAFDIFADISPSVFFWCDLYIYFRETIVCKFFLSVWGVCVCYRRWTSQTDLDDAGPSKHQHRHMGCGIAGWRT